MKKLVLILFLISGVGISLLYYYWRQATQLPEWYSSQSDSTTIVDSQKSANLVAAKAKVLEKIETRIAHSQGNHPTQNVAINLDNHEVNELITAKIAEQADRRKVLTTVRAVHTSIKQGKLESGAIVNLSNLPNNQLSDKDASLEKLLKTFPFLKSKEFYVGISGTPRLESGQLQWDDKTKIKIGTLNFTINELSQRLGVSPERLQQELNVSMQLGKLKVKNLEVTDNQVLLKGSVD